MNRVLVAGIAGLAMLLTASADLHAGFGRKCGGDPAPACGGGLFSKLGSRAAERGCGGGGLFAKLRANQAADCCAPVDTCCEPAPVCCEPAPAPSCCEPAPAPCCCTPAPACGGCAPVVSSGCGGCGSVSYASSNVVISGCANCSTTMDGGMIMESAAPSVAPPAPAPIADPAASASDAPEA